MASRRARKPSRLAAERGHVACHVADRLAAQGEREHLAALAQRLSAVHLVDVDRGALEGAVALQPLDGQARLALHAPVDLSGLLDKLER